ncbi:MAG TPA: translation elongation factor Ts [Acidimicrobiales bacterium]|jgi:elongation factor Ts
MAEFTAKDVQALRQATGAGMMDAKRALEEAGGDAEQAAKILREKGLAKASTRTDRDNAEGAIAVASTSSNAVLVELKCETDFVAKSESFTALAQQLADAFAADGPAGLDGFKDAVDDLKVTLKENIDIGRTVSVDIGPDHVVDTYLHRQEGRGVNGVIAVLSGGTAELAHDIAVHIAFTKPQYQRREDVPAADVEAEKETLLKIVQAEGKPEAAWEKILDGRLGGWYKERVLLDQPYVRDEKQTITQLLAQAGAELVSYAQIYVGA